MRKTIKMIILCLAGVMLNFGIYRLFHKLGIPLYMDTVATIAVTLTGGLFWGSLCGALTNIISQIIEFWGWEGYLFTLCNIATAAVTWLFIKYFPRELNLASLPEKTQKNTLRNKIMDLVVVLFLLSFALCIVMSVLGGMISTFIIHVNKPLSERTDLTGILSATMFQDDFPLILKEILSRIPINSIDRLISAFFGYGLALLFRGLLKDRGLIWRLNIRG